MSELDDLRRRIERLEKDLEALYVKHDSTPAQDIDARYGVDRAISATRGAIVDFQRQIIDALVARLAEYEHAALDVVWDGKGKQVLGRVQAEEHWPNV